MGLEQYLIYLENEKKIKELQLENKKILDSIQESALNNCQFKIGDVIKGREYIGNKIRAVKIQSLKAIINENGFISYIASGYPMNLDGSFVRNNNNTRKICIDEDTLKLD